MMIWCVSCTAKSVYRQRNVKHNKILMHNALNMNLFYRKIWTFLFVPPCWAPCFGKPKFTERYHKEQWAINTFNRIFIFRIRKLWSVIKRFFFLYAFSNIWCSIDFRNWALQIRELGKFVNFQIYEWILIRLWLMSN